MSRSSPESNSRRYFDGGTSGVPRPHFDLSHDATGLDRIRSARLDLSIELGRTTLSAAAAKRLVVGTIVPLDEPGGQLVDVVVAGRLIARGEVVVIEDNFCVRIVELIASAEAA